MNWKTSLVSALFYTAIFVLCMVSGLPTTGIFVLALFSFVGMCICWFDLLFGRR